MRKITKRYFASGEQWGAMSSKVLRQNHLYVLAGCSLPNLSPELAVLSRSCSFPWHCYMFLAFLTSWYLSCTFDFIISAAHHHHSGRSTLLDISHLPFIYTWNPQDPQFLHSACTMPMPVHTEAVCRASQAMGSGASECLDNRAKGFRVSLLKGRFCTFDSAILGDFLILRYS